MTKKRRFPGFEQCLKMMRSSNGSVSEEGFGWLAERAAEYVPQFIAAFWDDDNAALRPWLMELIGDAKSPAALPFLLERLNDENESIRDWAVRGLRHLDTKEARTALWRAGVPATAQD
jgi:HEAT repeat protein